MCAREALAKVLPGLPSSPCGRFPLCALGVFARGMVLHEESFDPVARIVKNVADIARWRLCLGCGVCAFVCPKCMVYLADFPTEGIRPVLEAGDCGSCNLCLQVCPVVETDLSLTQGLSDEAPGLGPQWGPVLEIWEGHASDPEIRFRGASGGVLTALSIYSLEILGLEGVLHTGQDPHDALRNRTRLSRSREELLAAAGSRYSPGSVCQGLSLIQEAKRPCVFIGRPVEIAGLQNAQKSRPELRQKTGLVFSFFCAESPSTSGTINLLKKLGLDPEDLVGLRYRGEGWPGHFSAVRKGEREPAARMTYQESWSYLQAYRPWAAHLWPDATGELADISCGDPWYMTPGGENPGVSLVVVRSQRGREILHGAMDKGYLQLSRAEPWKLIKSQEGLIRKKGAVWGRLLVMRLLGLPVPRFRGGRLFNCWVRLPLEEKLRSTLGTARRIIARRLYRPLRLDPQEAVPVKPAMAGRGG